MKTNVMKSAATKMVLLIIILFSLSTMLFHTKVQAANVCTQTYGSSAYTRSFSVETGSRWLWSDKITFTQSKGTLAYYDTSWREKTKSAYDCYQIQYKKRGYGSWTTVNFFSSSKTIKLDKNTTYDFKVIPGPTYLLQQNRLRIWQPFKRWVWYPSWNVKTTKGIIRCY